MSARNGWANHDTRVRLGAWLGWLTVCLTCGGCITVQAGHRNRAADVQRTRQGMDVLVAAYLPHLGRLAHQDGGRSAAEAVGWSVVEGLRQKGHAVGSPLLLAAPVPKTASLGQFLSKRAGDAVPGAEAYRDGIQLDPCKTHALQRACDRLRRTRCGKSAPVALGSDLAALGLSSNAVTVLISVEGQEYTDAAWRENVGFALFTCGLCGYNFEKLTVEMKVLDVKTGEVLWMATRCCPYGGFPEDRLQSMVDRLVKLMP